MDQITIVRLSSKLSKREQLVLLEIGGDAIDSASSFVDYMSEAYGFSKSSIWYVLNRLKERRLIDFASKEEQGKALTLTKEGMQELRGLERQGIRLELFAPNDPIDWHSSPEHMIRKSIAVVSL